MPIRFYLVPGVGDGSSPAAAHRPKYIADLVPQIPWGRVGADLEGVHLTWADVTPAQHAALVANADVLPVPANLDNTVSAVALVQIQTRFDAHNIPRDWITTANTYREVVRFARKYLQFLARFQRNRGRFWTAGLTLDSTVGDLPAAVRQHVNQAATELGADTSGITLATTLRVALRTLVGQFPGGTMAGEVL